MNRGNKEHYFSAIQKVPDGSIVKSLSWEGECTSSSWVEVAIRTAETEKMVEQSEWIEINAGEDISSMKLGHYVQYRLALCAKCACGTPRIQKVTVNYI